MAPRRKIQSAEQITKELPTTEQILKTLPNVGVPENTVLIGGKFVEIKPTKLKYQRNRTALFYKFMELYPLAEIVSLPEGSFGDTRDGDKCVMDFLIAAVDDEKLIQENYDEMDTEVVEKILSIFRKVNHIDEKEEKQKKAEELRKAVV